jgi:hypothetical protein
VPLPALSPPSRRPASSPTRSMIGPHGISIAPAPGTPSTTMLDPVSEFDRVTRRVGRGSTTWTEEIDVWRSEPVLVGFPPD